MGYGQSGTNGWPQTVGIRLAGERDQLLRYIFHDVLPAMSPMPEDQLASTVRQKSIDFIRDRTLFRPTAADRRADQKPYADGLLSDTGLSDATAVRAAISALDEAMRMSRTYGKIIPVSV